MVWIYSSLSIFVLVQVKREMCPEKLYSCRGIFMSLYWTKIVELGLKEKHFHESVQFFLYLIHLWTEPLSDKF